MNKYKRLCHMSWRTHDTSVMKDTWHICYEVSSLNDDQDNYCYFFWEPVCLDEMLNSLKLKNPNHTSLNENYVIPCICLRAIWHMYGSMWRATWMTHDQKRIIMAHCVIKLWRHYYYALAKFYCRGRVEGHFSGYPNHKTYTCHNSGLNVFGTNLEALWR